MSVINRTTSGPLVARRGVTAMNDPSEVQDLQDNGKHNTQGISRRRFLQGSGVAAAATALTGEVATLPAAQDEPRVPGMGPGAVKITLNINGRKMGTSVEPRVTLLDALRNHLD